MKLEKETLKEIGKAFFNFGNLVGGLSIVNSFFGKVANLPYQLIFIIVLYIIFGSYLIGTILLNKGAKND